MGLQELADISRFYGTDSSYVIAGGGNTSFKDEKFLYIKASGTQLAAVKPEEFVKMDRAKLAAIWGESYPKNPDEREAAVLAGMMAARSPGEEKKRPSVETLLHDMLPFTYVVHLHPTLVNGLTCAKKGKKLAAGFFGGDSIWIPITNPGYVLATLVKKATEQHKKKTGKDAAIIFLQNHGVFTGANSVEGIKTIYKRIMDTLASKIIRQPGPGAKETVYDNSAEAGKELCRLIQKNQAAPEAPGPVYVSFVRNAEIAGFVKDEKSFRPVSSAYTPDHIVYAGSHPLFLGKENVQDAAAFSTAAEAALKKHIQKTGLIPKTIAVQNMGMFGFGNSQKTADTAAELILDAVKLAVYTESFGGPLFMTKDKIDFINNWEVERYRSRVASG
jgi:rhamnose utilization protein RhaD (predicted bifunctional aldolase and dehydrogenase)